MQVPEKGKLRRVKNPVNRKLIRFETKKKRNFIHRSLANDEQAVENTISSMSVALDLV
jgi:hypothetical protein